MPFAISVPSHLSPGVRSFNLVIRKVQFQNMLVFFCMRVFCSIKHGLLLETKYILCNAIFNNF